MFKFAIGESVTVSKYKPDHKLYGPWLVRKRQWFDKVGDTQISYEVGKAGSSCWFNESELQAAKQPVAAE